MSRLCDIPDCWIHPEAPRRHPVTDPHPTRHVVLTRPGDVLIISNGGPEPLPDATMNAIRTFFDRIGISVLVSEQAVGLGRLREYDPARLATLPALEQRMRATIETKTDHPDPADFTTVLKVEGDPYEVWSAVNAAMTPQRYITGAPHGA